MDNTSTNKFGYAYVVESNSRGELFALTSEPLPIEGFDGRCFTLDLRTSKSGRHIVAQARVFEQTGGFARTDLTGDYSKALEVSQQGARGTEKNLRAIHEKALESFPQALEDAKQHTIAKLAKRAAQRQETQSERAAVAAFGAGLPDENGDFNSRSHPMHY